MDSLPGGVMALAPMSDLLQLPQSERLALAIALGGTASMTMPSVTRMVEMPWPDARMNVASMS